VLDQRRAHIGKHRAPMFGGAIELAMNLAVTHGVLSCMNPCHSGRREAAIRNLDVINSEIPGSRDPRAPE
jgi:hypothetical protein